MEIWKDIEGYEGLYQVSNMGNVRSCNWRNQGVTQNLYLKVHNKGYKHIELVKNGKRRSHLVHRLVAEAFLPNPSNYPVVNHIDEVKTNNNVENLEWCTLSQNMKAYYENHPGTNRFSKTRKRGMHNKTWNNDTWKRVNQYAPNGELVKTWRSSLEASREMNWSQWSISQCCRGKRHTAYGYKWEYAD